MAPWAPIPGFFGLGDVGLALFGIVLGQRLVNNFAARPGSLDDGLGELQHRHLGRVADVHRQLIIAHHQAVDAFDQIRDITKTARLGAFAEHRDGPIRQRLAHERRHDAAIVQAHPGAVGVEDADDTRLDLVFAVVGHRQRLGKALRLVVTAARADGVDIAPVFFRLGMQSSGSP